MHLRATSAPALRIVERMAVAFDGATGFELSSFMVSSRSSGQCLTRSFHCYSYGSFTLIQVHGSPRTAWARDIERRLVKAGYERAWRLGDELGLRRWISGRHARIAELDFLRLIGETGSPQLWPARSKTLQPVRPRKRPRSEWETVLDAARQARVRWDACAIGYSRRAVMTPVATTRTTLEVSAVAFNRLPSDLSIIVSAQLSDPAQELPPAIRRSCRELLRRKGYRVDLRKSQVWGTRPTRSAACAAREGARVFTELQELR